MNFLPPACIQAAAPHFEMHACLKPTCAHGKTGRGSGRDGKGDGGATAMFGAGGSSRGGAALRKIA